MATSTQVWVVAAKDDSDTYAAVEEVFYTFQDALEEAIEVGIEAPGSDPRVIQVLLDPSSPVFLGMTLLASLRAEQIAEDLADAAGTPPAPEDLAYDAGIERAMDLVEEVIPCDPLSAGDEGEPLARGDADDDEFDEKKEGV
jgi:hypothetical protein